MAADMALQVVVSPFLGVLFDNLSSLIHKEVGLIWGVDKEMRKLASILSTIHDVLADAEEKQITEKAVAKWLLKLRDLAYDADDILDEWETEARELKLGTEDIACSKQVIEWYKEGIIYKENYILYLRVEHGHISEQSSIVSGSRNVPGSSRISTSLGQDSTKWWDRLIIKQ